MERCVFLRKKEPLEPQEWALKVDRYLKWLKFDDEVSEEVDKEVSEVSDTTDLLHQFDQYICSNQDAGRAIMRSLAAVGAHDLDHALKQCLRAQKRAAEANEALCQIDLLIRRLRRVKLERISGEFGREPRKEQGK